MKQNVKKQNSTKYHINFKKNSWREKVLGKNEWQKEQCKKVWKMVKKKKKVKKTGEKVKMWKGKRWKWKVKKWTVQEKVTV